MTGAWEGDHPQRQLARQTRWRVAPNRAGARVAPVTALPPLPRQKVSNGSSRASQ
jgi:hypothetical protein